MSDFLQLCKSCKHFFDSDLVKIYGYFIISAAFYDIPDDTNAKFDMTDGVSYAVIQ